MCSSAKMNDFMSETLCCEVNPVPGKRLWRDIDAPDKTLFDLGKLNKEKMGFPSLQMSK